MKHRLFIHSPVTGNFECTTKGFGWRFSQVDEALHDDLFAKNFHAKADLTGDTKHEQDK